MKRTPLKHKSPIKRATSKRGSLAFKKAKKDSVSSWKKKADIVVSIYVRKSGADQNSIATCYTCGKKAYWRELQCGHFITRNNSATRYDMDNLRPQCPGCNVWGRGRYEVYTDKLLEELGTKRFKALLARGRTTHQLTVAELKAIVAKYELSTTT